MIFGGIRNEEIALNEDSNCFFHDKISKKEQTDKFNRWKNGEYDAIITPGMIANER